MKMYPMYKCDKCGKSSSNHDEIELCEAQHMGLTNLDDYRQWKLLNSLAASRTADLSRTNNETTRLLEEEAYANLFAFEKRHNVITK